MTASPRYTDNVRYAANAIGARCHVLDIPPHWVPLPFPQSPLWSRMHLPFDPQHFLYACPPVEVGQVILDTKGLDGLRTLRCPIKQTGTPSVWLPTELTPLLPLVRHVLELERHANPRFEAFCAHITFERTKVAEGATQRVPGWHVDGYQGVRVPRHQIEHSYLWADHAATEFCLQPFFVSHLDPARHNVFDELVQQAKEVNAFQGFPNIVYLIDPYLVHRSPGMRQTGWRSFVRITFTESELEDSNNTVNLAFSEGSPHAERLDVRNRLYPYQGDVPWHSYGVVPLRG